MKYPSILPPPFATTILASSFFLLSSCTHDTSYLEDDYKGRFPHAAPLPIPEGQHPLVMEVNDATTMLKRYEAAGYVVVGTINVTRDAIPFRVLSEFAKTKGASLVLAQINYQEASTFTYLTPVTKYETTQHNGPLYGGGSVAHSYTGYSTTSYTQIEARPGSYTLYKQQYYFLAPKA